MNQTISGINLTNISASACQLPVLPISMALTAADGTPVPPVPLPGPSGATSLLDFIAYGSAAAPTVPGSGIPVDPSPLTLLPTGTATELMYTTTNYGVTSGGGTACISTPAAGALAVQLDSSSTVDIAMPIGVSLPSTTIDPTGAAFSSCGAVVFSPFLTWSQATAIVGAPTPTSGATGTIPTVNSALYVNAP